MEISYRRSRAGTVAGLTENGEDVMPISYNHLETYVYPERIADNWQKLETLGGHAYAVIKADAYGHGLLETARALAARGAHTLCVGTVEEGLLLREDGYEGRIVALLGAQLDAEYTAAAEKDIIPFTGNEAQFRRLDETALSLGRRQRIAVKFDTGMGRFGFRPEDASHVADMLDESRAIDVVMVSSHLATADNPGDREYVLGQGQRFENAVRVLRERGYTFEANLANSAAILAYPNLRFDGQRPGIALYGCNVFWGTEKQALGEGFKPAMEVKTRVYQVHPLKKGESVSYGRIFTAERDMEIAIVGAGYADNYIRSFSNTGYVCIHGQRARVLGRICMQVCAVDVTDIPQVNVGDDVWLIGGTGAGAISAEEVADWCGTISYEILCLLGQNTRHYA